jgi:hypothetical protein
MRCTRPEGRIQELKLGGSTLLRQGVWGPPWGQGDEAPASSWILKIVYDLKPVSQEVISKFLDYYNICSTLKGHGHRFNDFFLFFTMHK